MNSKRFNNFSKNRYYQSKDRKNAKPANVGHSASPTRNQPVNVNLGSLRPLNPLNDYYF